MNAATNLTQSPDVLRAKATRRQVVNATVARLRAQGHSATPALWALVERTYAHAVAAYAPHPEVPPERLVHYLEGVASAHVAPLTVLFAELRSWLEARNA